MAIIVRVDATVVVVEEEEEGGGGRWKIERTVRRVQACRCIRKEARAREAAGVESGGERR